MIRLTNITSNNSKTVAETGTPKKAVEQPQPPTKHKTTNSLPCTTVSMLAAQMQPYPTTQPLLKLFSKYKRHRQLAKLTISTQPQTLKILQVLINYRLINLLSTPISNIFNISTITK